MGYDALMTAYVPTPQLQQQQQQQQQRVGVEGQGVEQDSSRDMKGRAGSAVAEAAEVVTGVSSPLVVGGREISADMSDIGGSGSNLQDKQEWTGGRGKMTAVSQQKEGWGLGEQDLTSQLLQLAPGVFSSTG